MQNQLQMLKQQLKDFPVATQKQQFNQIIHQVVPMFGNCGISVEALAEHQCKTSMASDKKVHNQIGSIQSAGIILTAESAMGLVIGINLPAQQVSLVKKVDTDFVKKVKGNIQAEAHLTQEQIKLLQETEKGTLDLEVAVTDETQSTVAICKATWAWFPLKK